MVLVRWLLSRKESIEGFGLRRYVVTEPFSPSSIEVHSHFSDVLQNSRVALDLTGTSGTKTRTVIKKSVLFHPAVVLLPFGGQRSIILL